MKKKLAFPPDRTLNAADRALLEHLRSRHVPLASRIRLRGRLLGTLALLALLAGIGLGIGHRAHSAGGAVAVQVTNTPLPTRDSDNAARQPFQTLVSIPIPDGSAYTPYSSVVIPSGKRLVVESVAVFRSGALTAGQSVQAQVGTSFNGQYSYMELPYVAATTAYNPGISQALRLYADPGTTIDLYVYRTGTSGSETDYVTISGYLVNVP